MAEEEKEAESKEEPESKKGGFLKEWRKLAGWQKAGVLIGGGALVVAILVYINRQPAPSLTGNSALPNSDVGNQPGAGDQFPPLPVPSTTTPTPISTPGTTPPIVIPSSKTIPDVTGGFRAHPIPVSGNVPLPVSSAPSPIPQPTANSLAQNVAQIYHRPAASVSAQNTHLQSAVNELYGRSHPAPLNLHPAQRTGFVPLATVPHAGTRPAPRSTLSSQVFQVKRGLF